MADTGNVFGTGTKFHSYNRLSYKIGSTRSEDMYAENLIGSGVGQDFHESISLQACTGTTQGTHRELSYFVSASFGL